MAVAEKLGRLNRLYAVSSGINEAIVRIPDELRLFEEACRIAVDLLALAHDRGCEAELAENLTADLQAGRLPDVATLRARFAPDPACVPLVTVELAPLASYESLLGSATIGEAA